MWTSTATARRGQAPGIAFAALSLVIIGSALLNEARVERHGNGLVSSGVEGSHQRQLRTLDPKTVEPRVRKRNARRQQQIQLQDEPHSPPSPGKEDDNYVVLLTCSHGFFDMYVNWLKYFQKLAIPNLPVHLFAEDEVMYNKCLEQVASSEYESVDLVCLPWDFVFDHGQAEDQDSGAASYKSNKYKALVSRRPAIIQRELELGRNVLYSDIDVVWLKDPMPYIREDFRRLDNNGPGKGEVHILAQGDYEAEWQSRKQLELCTGFVVYRSRPTTIAFVDLWKQRLAAHPGLNQRPFNTLAKAAASDIGLRAEILPQGLFVSGKLYFDVMTKEQREKAVVAHNNFIVGYDSKVDRFKEFGLWLVEG